MVFLLRRGSRRADPTLTRPSFVCAGKRGVVPTTPATWSVTWTAPMAPRFLALTVEPGVDCKVSMPPCSALEIKNAALAPAEKSFTGKGKQQQRCTLECDLATHHFVLCSLPPGGHQQASLGTVVTNDPDAPAWLFLKARGPRTFHVLGSIQVDESPAAAKKRRSPASRAPSNVFSAAASIATGRCEEGLCCIRRRLADGGRHCRVYHDHNKALDDFTRRTC